MISQEVYGFLDRAYSYFNEHLFSNQLQDCLITFNRKKGTYGYHHWQNFKHRENNSLTSEISLNPDGFEDRSVMEVLSTLTHEMAHNLQHVLDIAPRKNYHDKGFSRIMFDIGLQTSSTGEPDGKPVGAKMSHYIIQGGKFEVVCQAFLLKEKEHGFLWDSIVVESDKKEKKKTRLKWTCPNCMTSVMGKKELNLVCGDCMEKFIVEEDENELT